MRTEKLTGYQFITVLHSLICLYHFTMKENMVKELAHLSVLYNFIKGVKKSCKNGCKVNG